MVINSVYAVECGNIPTSGCHANKDTTFNTGTYSVNFGVIINKSNIFLDCNNSWLYGPNLNFGIRIVNKTGVTVKNCKLTNYEYGIYLRKSNYNNIIDNEFSDNIAYGVFLRESNNNGVVGNTFLRNLRGVYLQTSQSNIVYDNTLTDNSVAGVNLDGSFSNEVVLNQIINNDNAYGVWIRNSDKNIINSNHIREHRYGIFTQNADKNIIKNNIVKDNTDTTKIGMYLQNSNENDVQGNTVTNNFHGVFLELSSVTNNIEYNNIFNNDGDVFSYDFFNNQGEDVSALHNWWGTTVSSVIDDNIYDDDEDGSKGVVDYSDWLNGFFNITNKTVILMNSGWNLISIPLDSYVWSLPQLLDSIEGKYDKVLTYGSEWSSYNVEKSDFLNGLQKINETIGFWIHMLETSSLEVQGVEVEVVVFSLHEGWNLIGYPSLQENGVGYVFADVMNDIERIFMYDNTWKDYNGGTNSLLTVKPGFGYWIKVNKNTEWIYKDGKFSNYTSKKTFSRDLDVGWNLVSIPLVLDNKALPDALDSISGNYDKVFAYDGEWKIFDPNDLPHSNLNSVDEKMGFWVKMNNEDTLVVEGLEVSAETDFSLNDGYNLIGYPNLEEKNIYIVFNNVNNSLVNVLSYESEWKSYNPLKNKSLNTLKKIKPGYGYWVNVNGSQNWSFNNGFK